MIRKMTVTSGKTACFEQKTCATYVYHVMQRSVSVFQKHKC